MNPTRAGAWEDRTDAAIAAFRAADTGSSGAMAYAYMTAACAALDGWDSTAVATYLTMLRALKNPDGGYGLNKTADAFQDGSTNPASTSYTVTMAHHVGPVLLEAWRAGVVDAAEVQQQVTALLGIHRFVTTVGTCLAYSTSTNDWNATGPRSLYQVHNANATAAAFFWACRGAGFTGIPAVLIVAMTRHLAAAYNPAFSGWPYSAAAATVTQDRDHQSATAEGAHMLLAALGRECAYQLMTTTGTGVLDPLAHMRLVSLPGDANSMSLTEPDQTVWLVYGDGFLTEFDAFLLAQAATPDRLAQAAYYAARAYVAASA